MTDCRKEFPVSWFAGAKLYRRTRDVGGWTPADVYFGRAETILAERQRIKRDTIANRRLQHRLQVA